MKRFLWILILLLPGCYQAAPAPRQPIIIPVPRNPQPIIIPVPEPRPRPIIIDPIIIVPQPHHPDHPHKR